MIDELVLLFKKYNPVLISILFGVKLYAYLKYKNGEFRIANLLFFDDRNIIRSEPKIMKFKKIQNRLSFLIVLLVVFQILIGIIIHI